MRALVTGEGAAMERRSVRIRGLLAGLMVCLLVAGTGCAGRPAPPDTGDLTTVRVAMFPAANTLPVHTAITTGMFERNGLRIELTETTDLPVAMAALSKGDYDIVMSVPTLVLIGAEKKLDIQVVAGLQRQTRERPNAVWISRDPGITTLGQLAGKTVAVPSVTGIIADALAYLLPRNGVDARQVKLVPTPFPTMGDQLQAGRVDAAVATNPFFSAIAARGFAIHDDVIVEAVADATGGSVDYAVTSVWCGSTTFARDHPDTITAWRATLMDAIDYLNDDESQARAQMQSWLNIPAPVLDAAQLPDWTVEMSPKDLAPYVTIARAVGSISTDPDVNALVWQRP